MTLTSGQNSIKPLRQILNCNFEPIVLVVVFAQLKLICFCDQENKIPLGNVQPCVALEQRLLNKSLTRMTLVYRTYLGK